MVPLLWYCRHTDCGCREITFMFKLLFFAKVTLLCNICFLVTFALRFIPALEQGVVTSTLLILGNIIAIVFNILFHLIWLFMLLTGRSLRGVVPVWMIAVNFIFLIIQIILLVK